MTNVFAIIVTYNAMRRNWIDKCLQSLQQSSVPVTPVVVDNGSSDGTRDHVPTCYPQAVWLPQEQNLGFGQANNVGMVYALNHNATHVLLLNQDAWVQPDTIGLLLKAGSETDMLLSPMQLNGDGTALDAMFSNTLKLSDNHLLDDMILGHALQPFYPTVMFAAACWFMPISIIEKVGGFNPLFFHYGEDDNYYGRTKYHGFKSAIVPFARINHDRELHGNIKLFNKNRLRRDLLVILCDINLSLLGRMKKLLHKLVMCYHQDLPARQYKIGGFTLALAWILSRYPTIHASRKQEKKTGRTWLLK